MKEMISDGTGNSVELEGEGDGDTLEVRRHKSNERKDSIIICMCFRRCVFPSAV